jgi:hypothetical protein
MLSLLGICLFFFTLPLVAITSWRYSRVLQPNANSRVVFIFLIMVQCASLLLSLDPYHLLTLGLCISLCLVQLFPFIDFCISPTNSPFAAWKQRRPVLSTWIVMIGFFLLILVTMLGR